MATECKHEERLTEMDANHRRVNSFLFYGKDGIPPVCTILATQSQDIKLIKTQNKLIIAGIICLIITNIGTSIFNNAKNIHPHTISAITTGAKNE